jgi:hypothetical protein
MTLTLSAFLGQDVGTVCLTVFKAVSRLFEALCSTTFCLNLRHFYLPLRIVNKQQQVERTKPQPRIATALGQSGSFENLTTSF